MTDEPENVGNDNELADVVAAEERQLHGSPTVEQETERLRRESDSPPTEETMLTAWHIQEAKALAPRLDKLQADADQ